MMNFLGPNMGLHLLYSLGQGPYSDTLSEYDQKRKKQNWLEEMQNAVTPVYNPEGLDRNAYNPDFVKNYLDFLRYFMKPQI